MSLKNYPSIKKVFFISIAVLVIPFLMLLAAELLARLYVHFCYGVPGKTYGIYMFDKEIGAIHRPNSYNSNSVINNWGFRNKEDNLEQKPKGVTRIYCSGGSTNFCYNLRTEESWPSILQRNLRGKNSHQHDEVLNVGEISFTISHEFALAKRIIPLLKPDIVVLYGTGINEILGISALIREGKNLDELLKKKKWGVFSQALDQARFLKRTSVLVRIYDYYIKKYFLGHFSKIHPNQASQQMYVHPWVIKILNIPYVSTLTFFIKMVARLCWFATATMVLIIGGLMVSEYFVSAQW